MTDPNNNDFVIKLMCAIGLQVPTTSHPERALVEVAKEHNLLGEKHSNADLEVPHPIYLHTSGIQTFHIIPPYSMSTKTSSLARHGRSVKQTFTLMMYAIRRSAKNPESRRGTLQVCVYNTCHSINMMHGNILVFFELSSCSTHLVFSFP